MLVTSISCSGDPGIDTFPPHSQMLSRTVSPGPSWRSPPASSWEGAAQCPEISVPAPLTLPWHLTHCAHSLLGPGRLRHAALLLPHVGSAEGARSAQSWPPTQEDSPGHTPSSTAACLSKARIEVLAQLGLCPLPFPPADVPAAAWRHCQLPSTEAKGFQHRHIHTPLARA